MEHSINEQLHEAQKELRNLKSTLLYHLTECGDVGCALQVTAEIFDLKIKITDLQSCQFAEARKKLLANTKRWSDTCNI